MLSDFRHGYLVCIFGTASKHTREASIKTTPFQNQTSKPNPFKALKANASSSFLIANVLKLRFYQNKGLFMDRYCEVPNTFSTRNQTSKLKNPFLSLGSVIKSNRVR